MTSLISLPPEVLHRIFSQSDVGTCKLLRSTCQRLRDIGSEWVFREALLSAREGDCEKLESILADPKLARCVSKFHFDLIDWEEDCTLDPETNEILGEDSLFPKNVLGLLKRLPEFPNLRDVTISFHPDCVSGAEFWDEAPQMPPFRMAIMKRFLQSVVSLPRLPRQLAFRNLQNINTTDSEAAEDLQKVLGAARSLRLNVATQQNENNPENDVEYPELHSFCDQLPSLWLKPMLSNLQHLTLYQSTYFGFYPRLDLSGIHFPHLKSLCLGNYTFVHDSQLEWILSHGSTLTELYLDDCPILCEVAVWYPEKTVLDPALYSTHAHLSAEKRWFAYEKRWHDYFRAFQERLPHLRVFRFGHSESWWRDDKGAPFEAETMLEPHFATESYLVYCEGYGPSQYMTQMLYSWKEDGESKRRKGEEMKPSEEDRTALRELCAKIGQKTREELRGF